MARVDAWETKSMKKKRLKQQQQTPRKSRMKAAVQLSL